MIATGFLRSYAKVNYREKDNPQFRYEYLDDMIGTIGRGVLGLTVNCARCHNHKFDPIAQKDYYKMQASLFGYVETSYPLAPKEDVEANRKKAADVNAKVAPLRAEIRKLEAPYREKLRAELRQEILAELKVTPLEATLGQAPLDEAVPLPASRAPIPAPRGQVIPPRARMPS